MAESAGPQLAYQASVHELAKSRLAQLEDDDLVDRVLRGQDVAFEALMDRYSPMVMGFLSGKLRKPGDVEDLAQEVFLSAFRRLNSLRSAERFGPWLMRITRNQLTDFYRSRARRPQLVSELPNPDDDNIRPWEWERDRRPGPRQLASESETRNVVFEEIGRLGDKYRDVLHMRLLGESTTEEIAEQLGLLTVTARMRLYRGMGMLRKALKRRGLRV
jgi:RNA polymerase sigma-70 factor, ECF subfamily